MSQKNRQSKKDIVKYLKRIIKILESSDREDVAGVFVYCDSSDSFKSSINWGYASEHIVK